MADLIPPEHRGKISGSRAFFMLISASIGQILGGLIYENVSHQLPLYIMWASTIPAFFMILSFVREPEKEEIIGV
jgi:MFS family permease